MNKSLTCLVLVLGLLVSLLAGCATGTGPSSSALSVPERPSSDQPIQTRARLAAKRHVELGTAYLRVARLGVALDEANIAVAIDTTYAPGHLLKALVYAELEQFDVARPAFEEAARLAPGDPEINNAYGWFLCSQGQETQGLLRLEQAARNPYFTTPAKAWANAGMCLMHKKDDVGAEERFLRAIAQDEQDTVSLFFLAEIALRNDMPLRAKQWVDALMSKKLDPGADVLWLVLRVEQKMGNEEAVKRLAERLRTDFPGSLEYQNYLKGKFE